MFYLTLHLSHLSGELDLCGVGELRVKRGRSSFNQRLRPIVHLRRYRHKERNISPSWLEITDYAQDHISHKACGSCAASLDLLRYLTLQLRHLQSALYFRSVGELGVEGDRGLSLPVFFVLFLRSDQTGSEFNQRSFLAADC